MAAMFNDDGLGSPSGTPVIIQSEASECGLACIAMVASAHGHNVDLGTLRMRFSVSLKGATLKQLVDIAEEIGFVARPLRGEIGELRKIEFPAILHWDLNHFVVLAGITGRGSRRRFIVHDPAIGRLRVTEAEFAKRWTGILLELMRSDSFHPRTERRTLGITQLWSSSRGFWTTIRQIALLSIVIQIIALAGPFYLQIAIDQALPSSDTELLLVLALGFGGLAVIDLVSTWLRSIVVLKLNNSLSYHIVVNLFRHLMRLPLSWFEKRHVGDVISRFGATQPISQVLSNGLFTSLLDGIMALTTLALMFIYSPELAALATMALASYLALRLAFFQALRLRSVSAITTAAAEQSAFIESVRGIAAIKSFGQEGNRQRIWQRKKADAVNAAILSGTLSAAFDAAAQFVIAIERVLFIYIAVSFALRGTLTVGTIFAFQAYKQQFLDAGIRLVGQAVGFKLLSVHLGRMSDIALSPPEDKAHLRTTDLPEDCGAIELRDVRYSYGVGEAPVLAKVNLKIEPGELVAFVGPSGGGKTTLMKLMMGLFEPTGGQVLIGGRPLLGMSKQAYRRRVGSVAQNDNLYAGSLAQNIAFFDPEPNMDRVRECARLANINHEIEALPLRYDTLVGDMGSTLSGGQKQRVLLARALYSQPQLLFMDEGTANLDHVAEDAVMTSLTALTMTRIVIAHRPMAVQAADRVFLVSEGRVQQLSKALPKSRSPKI
ncbi:peptidase domain-containing ABC transporter [uncultured Sphingomonas sp.]|uniref:peptidase domain-containing ABC transporter n=1 Tax=uncultured Sphingomonas sp. TaxID=158754 RepID=UPI0025D2C19C|nr:peptidase domain-containing ABC transporter [uncultured Sphingomonas sp.]